VSHSQRQAVDPAWNPSYPQRVHLRERAGLLDAIKQLQARVEQARSAGPSKSPADRASRTLAQMRGALDQMRDAAARMPTEVGDLYAEDRHRFDEAAAALARLLERW
jgi:hypothetical protein